MGPIWPAAAGKIQSAQGMLGSTGDGWPTRLVNEAGKEQVPMLETHAILNLRKWGLQQRSVTHHPF